MKRSILLAGLLLFTIPTAFSQESNVCKPANLVCDYLVNPLGIDNPTPRLSWMLNDVRKGARQTAYQISVGQDSLEVATGKGKTWDSGKRRPDRYWSRTQDRSFARSADITGK